MSAQKRCVSSVVAEVFDFFSQREDWDSCDGLSWENSLELSDCDPEAWADVCGA